MNGYYKQISKGRLWKLNQEGRIRILPKNMKGSKKYHLNREETIKVLKGAAIAATGGAALFILEALGAFDISNPTIAAFVAFSIPTLTNLVKNWLRDSK